MTMTTTRAWTDSALGGRSTVNIESPVQSIESTINCSDVLAVAAWNDQLDAQLYPASLVDRAVTPVCTTSRFIQEKSLNGIALCRQEAQLSLRQPTVLVVSVIYSHPKSMIFM